MNRVKTVSQDIEHSCQGVSQVVEMSAKNENDIHYPSKAYWLMERCV